MKRLPFFILFVSSAIHAQIITLAPALQLGPERRVSQQRLAAYPSGEQIAGLVSDRSGFLAVWLRRGSYSERSTIRAVFVDEIGRVHHETTRVLVEDVAIGAALAGRTAAGPLLVWSSGQTVYAQRIGNETRLIGQGRYPRGLQCNESRCVVSWGSTATILDGDASVIRDDVTVAGNLAPLAADPGGFLFAGFRDEEVVAIRLDNDGRRVFEAVANRPFSRPQRIAADFDGTRYVLTWTSVSSIWAASVALDGTMSAPTRPFDTGSTLEAITWNGWQHLLLLSISQGCFGIPGAICPTKLYTIRLDSGLVALDDELRPLMTQPGSSLAGALAAHDGVFYASFFYFGGQPGIALMASRLDPNGAALTTEAISLAPQQQRLSALLSVGNQHVAFWAEPDAANGKILLQSARVFRSGIVLDSDPHTLVAADKMSSMRAARVGSDVLVTWSEGEPWRSRSAIMHLDGSLTPSDPPHSDSSETAIAGSNTAWLVASAAKQASLISRAGVNLTPQPVSISDYYAGAIASASDGQRFLVAFSQAGCGGECEVGTLLTLVNADGSIAFRDRKIADGLSFGVAVSWNGHEYLVATAVAYPTPQLLLRRVDAYGNAIGTPTVISSSRANGLRIASLRVGWLVTFWTDTGIGSGVRVAKDGRPLEAPFPIDAPLALVANDDGTATSAFMKNVDFPPFGIAPVTVLRDIMWSPVLRRRAAR